MIATVREWYLSRTQREQYLLLAMVAIAAPLLVWLLIVRPVSAAYDVALKDHLEAVDRHGRVVALAEAAKAAPASQTRISTGADMSLVVTEAATQAGVALQGANPSGPNAVEVSVGGGQSQQIMQWLRAIETQGLTVEQLRMTPLPDGSVNMTARLARAS